MGVVVIGLRYYSASCNAFPIGSSFPIWLTYMFKLTVLNVLICVHLTHAMPTLVAQETNAEQRATREPELYVRVTKGDGGSPRAMQTAIARYEGKAGTKYEGIRVDLVGVVHIGEDEYYSALNRRLGKYDSVLYELVARWDSHSASGFGEESFLAWIHAERNEGHVESGVPIGKNRLLHGQEFPTR